MAAGVPALLSVQGVAKRYGPVVALRSADLTVQAGQVHALLGANGAGKSTLVKILTGVITDDGGVVSVNGTPRRFGSPAAARAAGLAPVFQDPALIPDLTVEQNLRLTRSDPRAVRASLAAMDLDVDFDELVSDLPLATLRMLDLARAMSYEPQLLLLDEITAALPADLAAQVFEVMNSWRDGGRSVLFISHRLSEVMAICDHATVLRDGRTVAALDPREGGHDRLVQAMMGEAAQAMLGEPTSASDAVSTLPAERSDDDRAPALEMRGLGYGDQVDDVSLTIRPGEVLGLAALEGQGQDVLFDLLAGEKRASRGGLLVDGRPLRPRTPYDAIRRGVVLVPSDRLMALLPQRPVRENLAAALYNRIARWGPVPRRDEQRRVQHAIDRLSIDTRAQSQVRRLSGGNQQKVTIGRWLAAGFKVLLCFDPTRGIDIGTKHQVYDLIRELAAEGAAVLLYTSELPEIALVCDRVAVMYGGRIVHRQDAATADEQTLLTAAHGLENGHAA